MAGPLRGREFHFIGIGGSGLSAYARLCHQLGASVSGSDRSSSPYLQALEAEGVVRAAIGHRPENLPDSPTTEVVHSAAVPADNPELLAARKRGLVVRSRAELLAELTSLFKTVVVAGTHGKTTTAAMVRRGLCAAGLEVGWLIGGEPEPGLPNGEAGGGEWLVVEGDESDRSMVELRRDVAVLTNVELDHPDRFTSLSELRELFAAFLAGAQRCAVPDHPDLLSLAPKGGKVIRYRPCQTTVTAAGTAFNYKGISVQLQVIGEHNASNAAAALAACELVGVDLAKAAAGLAGFPGAGRRFSFVGKTASGALVYDDYAHHPTELEATLRAARAAAGGGRVIAVFQPHLFSRTKRFHRRFGQALAAADLALCLEVFPAREEASSFPGVDGLLVAQAAATAARGRTLLWARTFEEGVKLLAHYLRPGDLVVVAGAGDVYRFAKLLVEGGDGQA